jgi:acyl-CoA thioester hydrolase
MAAVRHVYECPLRWADLDLLGHVNNVIYVDYLQEARIDMLVTHAPDRRADELAEGVVVVRHEVRYVSPLTFSRRSVKIECWVSEIRAASFTMNYEIFADTDEGRVVYLQALTVLTPYVFATERPRRITAEERTALEGFLEPTGPRERLRPEPPRRTELGHYPLHVRFSDVDVYGHVNNVKYFEYFQEARISFFEALNPELRAALDVPLVVAQTDVDYRVPITFRPEPYDMWTWVSRVGTSSFVLEAVIADNGVEMSRARVVAVTFDAVARRAAPMPVFFRDRLVKQLEA